MAWTFSGFQLRVVNELMELDEKKDKLKAFIGTDTFRNLDSEDRELLASQLTIMSQYSVVLSMRVDRFKEEK